MARQSGYRVTIRGFLPADRKSIADTAKAIALVQKAMADPASCAELLDALVGVELDIVNTTRVVEDAKPAEPAANDAEPFA